MLEKTPKSFARPVMAVCRERPFDGRIHSLQLPPADRMPTVAQILAQMPDIPSDFFGLCECRINGDLVPREFWHLVRPRASFSLDIIVTYTVPLRSPGGSSAGGSGGGASKNPIATVATIAVLLVGAAVSGGALGALIPFGAAGASIAGAAIGVGGDLEIDALSQRSRKLRA